MSRLTARSCIACLAMLVAVVSFEVRASSSSSSASSAQLSAPSRGERPPGPPPEAMAACQGKSEGSKVTFKARNGESMEGVCRMLDGKLAAVPTNPPPPGDRPPPR